MLWLPFLLIFLHAGYVSSIEKSLNVECTGHILEVSCAESHCIYDQLKTTVVDPDIKGSLKYVEVVDGNNFVIIGSPEFIPALNASNLPIRTVFGETTQIKTAVETNDFSPKPKLGSDGKQSNVLTARLAQIKNGGNGECEVSGDGTLELSTYESDDLLHQLKNHFQTITYCQVTEPNKFSFICSKSELKRKVAEQKPITLTTTSGLTVKTTKCTSEETPVVKNGLGVSSERTNIADVSTFISKNEDGNVKTAGSCTLSGDDLEVSVAESQNCYNQMKKSYEEVNYLEVTSPSTFIFNCSSNKELDRVLTDVKEEKTELNFITLSGNEVKVTEVQGEKEIVPNEQFGCNGNQQEELNLRIEEIESSGNGECSVSGAEFQVTNEESVNCFKQMLPECNSLSYTEVTSPSTVEFICSKSDLEQFSTKNDFSFITVNEETASFAGVKEIETIRKGVTGYTERRAEVPTTTTPKLIEKTTTPPSPPPPPPPPTTTTKTPATITTTKKPGTTTQAEISSKEPKESAAGTCMLQGGKLEISSAESQNIYNQMKPKHSCVDYVVVTTPTQFEFNCSDKEDFAKIIENSVDTTFLTLHGETAKVIESTEVNTISKVNFGTDGTQTTILENRKQEISNGAFGRCLVNGTLEMTAAESRHCLNQLKEIYPNMTYLEVTSENEFNFICSKENYEEIKKNPRSLIFMNNKNEAIQVTKLTELSEIRKGFTGFTVSIYTEWVRSKANNINWAHSNTQDTISILTLSLGEDVLQISEEEKASLTKQVVEMGGVSEDDFIITIIDESSFSITTGPQRQHTLNEKIVQMFNEGSVSIVTIGGRTMALRSFKVRSETKQIVTSSTSTRTISGNGGSSGDSVSILSIKFSKHVLKESEEEVASLTKQAAKMAGVDVSQVFVVINDRGSMTIESTPQVTDAIVKLYTSGSLAFSTIGGESYSVKSYQVRTESRSISKSGAISMLSIKLNKHVMQVSEKEKNSLIKQFAAIGGVDASVVDVIINDRGTITIISTPDVTEAIRLRYEAGTLSLVSIGGATVTITSFQVRTETSKTTISDTSHLPTVVIKRGELPGDTVLITIKISASVLTDTKEEIASLVTQLAKESGADPEELIVKIKSPAEFTIDTHDGIKDVLSTKSSKGIFLKSLKGESFYVSSFSAKITKYSEHTDK